MRIRTRVLIAYLIIIPLMGIISYFGIITIISINNQFKEVATETIPVIEALEDIRFAGMTIVSSTAEFSLIKAEQRTGEKELEENAEKEQIEAGLKAYNNAFKRYEDLVNQFFPEDTEFLDSIRGAGQELQKTSAQLVALKMQGGFGREVLELREKFEQNEESFLNAVNEALARKDEELAERQEKVKSTITSAIITIITISIFVFIVAMISSFFIANSISNPIVKLKDAAVEIGKGNLDTRIQVKYGLCKFFSVK